MKPTIFIGSSVEGGLATNCVDAIVSRLSHTSRCRPWPTAFLLSSGNLDALISEFKADDFGIFLFSPDDKLKSRGADYQVARDNVLFEAGMFMGTHGKGRTFVIIPNDVDFHLPSDFGGFTVAKYDSSETDPQTAMSGPVSQILLAIGATKWQPRTLYVEPLPVVYDNTPGRSYPLKLRARVTNTQKYRALVTSQGFACSDQFLLHPNAPKRPVNLYDLKFDLGLDCDKKEIWERERFLEPDEQTVIWIPADDKKIKTEDVQELVRKGKAGKWYYHATWLNEGDTHFGKGEAQL